MPPLGDYMKLQELKYQIRDMAFEEDSQMAEYIHVSNNAINRGLKEVHTFDLHRLSTFTIEQDGASDESFTYNPNDFVEDFSRIEKAGIIQNKKYKTFNDYRILTEDSIVIDGSISGDIVFTYERKVREIGESTPDDEVLDVGYDCESMLALLVAYYVWIDDEETKAREYYNLYRRRRDDYMAKIEKDDSVPKAEFIPIGDVSWQ